MFNLITLMDKITEHPYFKGESNEDKQYAIQEFSALAAAIEAGSDVFLVCEKEPRSLDRGLHWYQIYYLHIDNGAAHRRMFWVPQFMDTQRDKHMRKYGFSSGAIGMSRALSATDHIFSLLKECGCKYIQPDVL